MGYVIPAGYARVTFEYTGPSGLGSAPSWGFGMDIDPSPAILADLVTWYEDEYQPQCHNAYTLVNVNMRSDSLVYDQATGLQGEVGTAAAPPNTSPLITLTTGLTGRANRGRIYPVGLLGDSEVDDSGAISSTRLLEISGLIGSLFLVLDGLGATLQILHSAVGSPTTVIGGATSGFVATQRRRLRA